MPSRIFFTTQAGATDTFLTSANVDGTNVVSQVADATPGSPWQETVIDAANNRYFILQHSQSDDNAILYTGQLNSSAAPTVAFTFQAEDLVRGLEIDPVNHHLFIGRLDFDAGQVNINDAATGLLQIDYNPATGAVSNTNNFLVTQATDALPSGFILTTDIARDDGDGTLYFAQATAGAGTNMIYRVDTSNNITTLLNQAQFPTNFTNGFIADVDVDAGRNQVYFSTFAQPFGAGPTNKLWVISDTATGSTNAIAVTLAGMPGGSTFIPGDFTIDQATHQLYVESEENPAAGNSDDLIYRFQLSADGLTATFLNTITPSLTTGNANIGGIEFVGNVVATLDLDANNSAGIAGSGYQATFTEGAAAVAIADIDTTIVDDGTTIASATITITNHQASDLLSVNGVLPGSIVASAYNAGTGVLTLTGSATLAQYQTALQQLRFSNSSDAPNTTDRSITVTVNDAEANSNTATATIHVAATNDAPVLTGDLSATVGEGGSYVITTTDLNFSDPDDVAAGVTFTVSSQVNGTVLVNGIAATTFTGTQLTGGQVSFLHNGSETTTASFNVSVEDGNEDGSAPVASTFNFTVNAVNDPPVLTGDLAATVGEGASYVITTADLNFTDPDDVAAGVTFTVSSQVNGTVLVNGIAATTFTGTQLAGGLVSFLHDGSEGPTASFNVSVEDGNEDGSAPVASTFNFTVNAVNDAPVLTGDLSATVGEGASYVITTADLNFADPDDVAAGVTFTVSSQVNGTVLVNGIAATTFTGTQLAGGLVSFLHDGSEGPTASFNVSVEDGNEDGSAPVASTFHFTVNNVDDPGVAQDDLFVTDEATKLTAGNVFANNGSGADSDPDTALTVTAVNGVGANVGTQITLASGALLTLNADGTFSYDPNGKFNDLSDSGSGANDLVRDDTFTYTISGGDTARVTVSVVGVDSEGDILRGTPGINNIFIGGIGSDLYFVDDATDTIIETAGNGTADRVASFVSFTLAADDDIEILSTNSSTGKSAIDLRGNALSQTIVGNDGKNTLHDGGVGGADTMRGHDGNDTYLVYNSGDIVIELAGEGNDRVSAGVDYVLGKGVHVELLNTSSVNATLAIDLTGNSFAQTIRGNAGDNILSDGGTGAADTLIGGKGNDFYQVYNSGDTVVELDGEGDDRVSAAVNFVLTAGAHVEYLNTTSLAGTYAVDLTGNELVQLVRGNDGANTLDGGGGADVLYGMGGADNFRFSTALAADNIVRIADFAAGTEKIELDAAIFTTLGLGGLSASAFKDTALASRDADDHIIYNSVSGALLYDADGFGTTFAAIRFATLTGSPTLTAADFVVV
jgi:Ca2+-binding RTX toxin-like protein